MQNFYLFSYLFSSASSSWTAKKTVQFYASGYFLEIARIAERMRTTRLLSKDCIFPCVQLSIFELIQTNTADFLQTITEFSWFIVSTELAKSPASAISFIAGTTKLPIAFRTRCNLPFLSALRTTCLTETLACTNQNIMLQACC